MKSFLKTYAFVIGLLACLVLSLLITLHIHPLGYYGIKSGQEVLLLLLIGLLAGTLGGLLGLGGGAIMLPALDFWLGYSSPSAIGTALFAVIFTVVSGAHGHYIRHNTSKEISRDISIGGMIGILVGSYIFTLLLSEIKLLNLCMGIFFLLPAYMMTRDGIKKQNESHLNGKHETIIARFHIPRRAWLLGLGFAVGLITGTLGLGGGFLLVPGITYGIGLSVHLAVGSTMLGVVPITIAGSLVKLAQGLVVLPAVFCLAIGSVTGAQIGAAVIKYFQAWTLKLVFGVYFLYVAIKYIAAFFE
ncbi:MAG: sulfite exporter TauE/SafE family protein [Deltaproteobacteria bacterium]